MVDIPSRTRIELGGLHSCVPRVETSGAVVHLAVNDCGSPKERSLGDGYPQKRI